MGEDWISGMWEQQGGEGRDWDERMANIVKQRQTDYKINIQMQE